MHCVDCKYCGTIQRFVNCEDNIGYLGHICKYKHELMLGKRNNLGKIGCNISDQDNYIYYQYDIFDYIVDNIYNTVV